VCLWLVQVGRLAVPICHLLVLGSACFNPLLYGWLNDNFRREFVKALCGCSTSCAARGSATAAAEARTVNGGARSAAVTCSVPAGGGVRPAVRRARRRPSNDIVELQVRDPPPADDCPEQLVSLVDKGLAN